MKKQVWLLVAVIVVAFVAAKFIAITAFGETQTEQALDAPPVLQCQLEHGCALGSAARVKSAEQLRLNQPFHITLTSDAPVDEVSVSFSMTAMEIGYNRYKLKSDDGKTWTAEIRLPVCTFDRADYIATWRVGGKKFQTNLDVAR